MLLVMAAGELLEALILLQVRLELGVGRLVVVLVDALAQLGSFAALLAPVFDHTLEPFPFLLVFSVDLQVCSFLFGAVSCIFLDRVGHARRYFHDTVPHGVADHLVLSQRRSRFQLGECRGLRVALSAKLIAFAFSEGSDLVHHRLEHLLDIFQKPKQKKACMIINN